MAKHRLSERARFLSCAKVPICSDSLTVSTFHTDESAFRLGRQTEAFQVKLSVAVTLTHYQTLSVRLADLHTDTQMQLLMRLKVQDVNLKTLKFKKEQR